MHCRCWKICAEQARARMYPASNAAISACEKGGQWQHALSLLEEMRMVDEPPDMAGLNTLHKIRKDHWWEQAALQTQLALRDAD